MVIETTILSLVLTYGILTRRLENSNVVFDSTNKCPVLIHSQTVEPVLVSGFTDVTAEVLAKDFGSIPEVDFVLTEDLNDAMLVWIVASDPQSEVRNRIYQKQLSLISEFPDIPFDFNLIRTQGKNPKELVSGANLVYSRPR